MLGIISAFCLSLEEEELFFLFPVVFVSCWIFLPSFLLSWPPTRACTTPFLLFPPSSAGGNRRVCGGESLRICLSSLRGSVRSVDEREEGTTTSRSNNPQTGPLHSCVMQWPALTKMASEDKASALQPSLSPSPSPSL